MMWTCINMNKYIYDVDNSCKEVNISIFDLILLIFLPSVVLYRGGVFKKWMRYSVGETTFNSPFNKKIYYNNKKWKKKTQQIVH